MRKEVDQVYGHSREEIALKVRRVSCGGVRHSVVKIPAKIVVAFSHVIGCFFFRFAKFGASTENGKHNANVE